ncbi:hypothetical protein [Sedimentibacter sp.]|uniref:hypothetical protein n=1 Tax=Sedimentibacter sp. TaxID=1960295 RepID=UPI0028A67205|nr:hypothetical protein [Sedimentibacter sp.]
MQVGTKEFYEILSNFEREFKDMRLDRENESLWEMGQVYQNGETNKLYLAYRQGYALGRCKYM